MARVKLSTRMRRAWQALTGDEPRRRRSVYEGADGGRLLADWVASRLAPDDEARWSIERMRARARDLERNNPIARQYLRLLAVNVIGPSGIRMQAQVRDAQGDLDRATNRVLEGAWDEWSQAPTLDGRMDLAGFSRLLLKTVARDGEVLVRKWRGASANRFGFALEAIDADQLDVNFNRASGEGVNEIRLGVEVDGSGRPVAYHVWSDEQRMVGGNARKRERIPADQIIHLYDPERVNQSRGVTWFASVMVPLRMLHGYLEAELVAARVTAAKMIFFERTEEGFGLIGNENGEAAGDGLGASGGDALMLDAPPGSGMVLPPGLRANLVDPKHPNAAFGDFVKAAMRAVATGLGVSYNALASDLEGVNYSSMRSGLLIERDTWRTQQQWWIAAFLRPVYAEWLSWSLLTGAVALGSRDAKRYLAARWTPRGWTWVDPLKDTNAGVLGIHNGLASRTSQLAEQGVDIEDLFEQLRYEKELAAEYDLELDAPGAPAPMPAPAGEDPAASDPEAADSQDTEDGADAGDGEDAAAGRSNGHTNGLARVLSRGRGLARPLS